MWLFSLDTWKLVHLYLLTCAAEFNSDFIQMGAVYMIELKIAPKNPFVLKKKAKDEIFWVCFWKEN